jgi:hypothetical protein
MYRGSISSGYIKVNSDILRLCKNMMKRYGDVGFDFSVDKQVMVMGEIRVRSSVDQVIGSRGLGCLHCKLFSWAYTTISSLIPALIFWYLPAGCSRKMLLCCRVLRRRRLLKLGCGGGPRLGPKAGGRPETKEEKDLRTYDLKRPNPKTLTFGDLKHSNWSELPISFCLKPESRDFVFWRFRTFLIGASNRN